MSTMVEPVSARNVDSLYTPPQIQLILQRERARVDRSQQEFSLVVVQLQEGGARLLDRVARILIGRARLTDEIGWFDSEQLCAVLPNTDSVGACCFGRSICEIARQSSLRIVCSVYKYPNPTDDDSSEGGSGGQRRMAEVTGVDRTLVSTQSGPEMVRRAARQGLEAELEQTGQRVAPMSELLVQPMPLWKRVLDIVGASVGLMIGTPIMLLAGATIKLTSTGPVVFRQRRAGIGGKPFSIIKLRTMVADAEQQKPMLRSCSEQDGPAFKMTSDPRVTTIGRWLRATSMDELPQFWNVLTGQMSLVGPRPLPIEESSGCAQWQRQRLDVTPGLTCIWQVRGRSRVTFDEWMRMDLEYVHRRTLWHDLKLLLLTLPAVILRRGAH